MGTRARLLVWLDVALFLVLKRFAPFLLHGNVHEPGLREDGAETLFGGCVVVHVLGGQGKTAAQRVQKRPEEVTFA